MFYTVQTSMHATNQKVEGNVWEMCVKSLLFSKLHCSVLLQILIREMFYTMQWSMRTVKILSLRYVLCYVIADVHYECNIINK